MIEMGVVIVTNPATYLNPRMVPLSMSYGEDFDIDVEDDKIKISSTEMNCPFCGRLGVKEFQGYYVCNGCRKELKKQNKRRR